MHSSKTTDLKLATDEDNGKLCLLPDSNGSGEVQDPWSSGDLAVEEKGDYLNEHFDILRAWATWEGTVSLCNEENGSWFIRALCDVLEQHYQEKDMSQILTMVNAEVAKRGTKIDSQCPVPENSFRKQLVFGETKKNSIEITEEDIKDAVNLDDRFLEAGELIKDVTTALFRSASIAKRDFVAKASLAGLSFDTTEDGEWSKGLISAAKSVLLAIISLCTIANEMVEEKASKGKINAATGEVRRATLGLLLSFYVDGYSECDSIKTLSTACDEVIEAAASLLISASSKYNTESEQKSVKKKSIALDSSEVQKAMKRIEAQETVMRKQKELEEAQRAKALINEEQKKIETETTETTEL